MGQFPHLKIFPILLAVHSQQAFAHLSIMSQFTEFLTIRQVLRDGDVISIDCGTLLAGYNGGGCYTFCVGEVKPEVKKLLQVTKESLYKGIEQAVAGHHVGDIGAAIQDYCESFGYGVVRELTGHGIGKEMHEDPSIPNYGARGNGVMLKEGMCIAIEPMITMGDRRIGLLPDKWGIVTLDGKPSAHFEHTIAVRKGKAEILSSFDDIENIQKKLTYIYGKTIRY